MRPARLDRRFLDGHNQCLAAPRSINAGVAIPVAMEAGAWRSVKVFVETYVHTVDASRSVADQFNTMRFDARL